MVVWGDVPTWVTAGAAVAALSGAGLAYRYQAQQVKLQRLQLSDQQEATRLQAQAIADQNRLREREQADAVTLTPFPWHGPVEGLQGSDEPLWAAMVENGWHRPIRKVACRLQLSESDALSKPRIVGRIPKGQADDVTPQASHPDESAVDFDPNFDASVLRAGDTAVFIFNQEYEAWNDPLMLTLRFTDDADLAWQIDNDLHLEKLTERDW
jgi:hypothetical protein